MPKEITYDFQVLSKINEGYDKLIRIINGALGPVGKNVLIDKSWGAPEFVINGHKIIDEIELDDQIEELGIKMLKAATDKTNDQCADGTSVTLLIAANLFKQGILRIANGVSPISIKRGIEYGVNQIVSLLEKNAVNLNPKLRSKLANAVAGDNEVAENILNALKMGSQNAKIEVQEGNSSETSVNKTSGYNFDRGYLSRFFAQEENDNEITLENPFVLVYEDKITNAQSLVPLLEKLLEKKASVLIIAEDVEESALSTLVLNKTKGILNCVAVKGPGFGDRRKEMLADIGAILGANVIFKDLGIKLEDVKMDDLGKAKKIIITKDDTTIFNLPGNEKAINKRIESIKKQLELTTSQYDKEKLEERLAKLVEGLITISVGGNTEDEIKTKKKQYEFTIKALKNANDKGILPGGYVPYIKAVNMLKKKKIPTEFKDGCEMLFNTLELPAKAIISNSGFDGDIEVNNIINNDDFNYGFDVVNNKFGNMINFGIIDPAKTVISAIINASSSAATLLMASCAITEFEEKEENPKKDK